MHHDLAPMHSKAQRDRFAYIDFLGDGIEPRNPRRANRDVKPIVTASAKPYNVAATTIDFFSRLCASYGLMASQYRESILWRRHAASLRAYRAKSASDAVELIGQNRDVDEKALSAVMIGVTAFFRDSDVFEHLGSLLSEMSEHGRELNAISVGCSDGSELYSLAMLLAERNLLDRAHFVGVDCRNGAIATAQRGVYSAQTVANVPSVLRKKYFRTALLIPGGGKWQIDEALRRRCDWRVTDAFSNFAQDTTSFDVIMCRNLTIYFTPEASNDLWRRMFDRLRPGGVLVVGRAERPPLTMRRDFTKVGLCLYRKNVPS